MHGTYERKWWLDFSRFMSYSSSLKDVLACSRIASNSLRSSSIRSGLFGLAVCYSSVGLQKIGSAGPPDGPYHVPPIKRNVPAITEDTSEKDLFHAGLPK
jgi:hypothetical protein